MITLIKLGGSLITDKNIPWHFRKSVMQRIASDIKFIAECSSPEEKLIIGHGSGSFGHVEAHKYNTIHGVHSNNEWLGFTKVAHAASSLSQLVATELIQADLPIFRFQPSASTSAYGGVIQTMNTDLLMTSINHDLIPLVHGDVVFDEQLGGTIVSTETIFSYLVQQLNINQIILLGEVDGVFDSQGNIAHHITPQSVEKLKSALGGSSGVDVTGGMYQKVFDMLELVQKNIGLKVIIANGKTPNILIDLICNNYKLGTMIST
jgi:isopentenyl phosphate kinase